MDTMLGVRDWTRAEYGHPYKTLTANEHASVHIAKRNGAVIAELLQGPGRYGRLDTSRLTQRILECGTVLMLATLLFMCQLLSTRPAFAADPIRIGWQPSLSYGMYTGMMLKTYEDAGLAPEHVKFESGPPMFAALASKSIDIAYLTVYPVIFGLAQGLDTKTFLVADDTSAANGLIVRRGSGIKSIADQKGKRIGVTFGSVAHFELIRSLRLAGLKESDLTVLDMGPSVIQGAFIRGDIDGAWIWEPWLVKLEKEEGIVVAKSTDLGMSVPVVWIVRSDFLRDHPETIQKFLRAWDRALQVKLTPELTDRIGNLLGMSREMTTTALSRLSIVGLREQLSGHPSSMGTSETKGQTAFYKQFREFADFLYENKKIKRIPDNLANTIEPQPVEQYLKAKQ